MKVKKAAELGPFIRTGKAALFRNNYGSENKFVDTTYHQ